MTEDIRLITASQGIHFAWARQLFEEYNAYLGEDLCFQSFEEELEKLPAMYGAPKGVLLLALVGNVPAGCVAIRPKGEGLCEMKRLFVQPGYQGLGLGRLLAEACLGEARKMHYKTMVLDTLERLTQALSLYKSLDFEPVAAYYHNPLPGVVYLQKALA